MRLPLAIPVDSRDGSVDQDGQMWNVVAESYEDKIYVEQRAALAVIYDKKLDQSGVGAAQGVVCYLKSDGTKEVLAMFGPKPSEPDESVMYNSAESAASVNLTGGAATNFARASSGNVGVALGNNVLLNLFFSGGYKIRRTTNGTTFTQIDAPATPLSVYFSGNIAAQQIYFKFGKFHLVSKSGTTITDYQSSDGTTWTPATVTESAGAGTHYIHFDQDEILLWSPSTTDFYTLLEDGWHQDTYAGSKSLMERAFEYLHGAFDFQTIADDIGESSVVLRSFSYFFGTYVVIVQGPTGVGSGYLFKSADKTNWFNMRTLGSSFLLGTGDLSLDMPLLLISSGGSDYIATDDVTTFFGGSVATNALPVLAAGDFVIGGTPGKYIAVLETQTSAAVTTRLIPISVTAGAVGLNPVGAVQIGFYDFAATPT